MKICLLIIIKMQFGSQSGTYGTVECLEPFQILNNHFGGGLQAKVFQLITVYIGGGGGEVLNNDGDRGGKY